MKDNTPHFSTPGTLVWIGNHIGQEFSPAYQYCESVAAQIAVRPSIAEAIVRPSTDVTHIVVAQQTGAECCTRMLSDLGGLYASAKRIKLAGSLCPGAPNLVDPFFGRSHHAWHRWNQVLPEFLKNSIQSGFEPCHEVNGVTRSVVVVAESYDLAAPLMELASTAGATSIWSRNPDGMTVQNADTYFWDDSVAKPTNVAVWKRRFESAGAKPGQTQHVWIANSPMAHQQRQAMQAGIDLVVSKPFRNHSLQTMLQSKIQQSSPLALPMAA